MPKDEGSPEETITCPICGYESPKGSTKCDHCYSSLRPAEEDPQEEKTEKEGELDELQNLPGVGEAKADILREAGYHSIKDIQKASVEELAAIKGIGDKLAAKIVDNVSSGGMAEDSHLADWLAGSEEGLSAWLSGEDKAQPEPAVANSHVPHDASLARWLSGQEEDINNWLEEPAAREARARHIGPNELLAREAELIQLRETLRQKLKQYETGEFNPQTTIEELAKARGDLELEKSKNKELEEELENIKRGSIAVIKFIKSQQGSEADQSTLTDRLATEMANRENLELKIMQLEEVVSTFRDKIERTIADLPPEDEELKRREVKLAEEAAQLAAMKKQLLSKEEALSRSMLSVAEGAPMGAVSPSSEILALRDKLEKTVQEMGSKIHDLEVKLAESEMTVKQKEEMITISSGTSKTIDKDVLKKLEDFQRLERTVAVREQEAQRLRDDLRIRDDELQKLKEPMRYKEEEMLRREEDLMFRERLLQEELKKVERTKAEITGTDELTLKKRLEELQTEVTMKEEEIRSKEKYIAMKEEELRLREQGVISDEIERREADRTLEIKQEKVKTGTARLDDLLLGGMPFGANVLIYGPPFTGKEVLVNTFMAEGLKKGVPVLWITTEKSPKELRDEMVFVVSGYEEYEKLGLVRYVDAYSRSMGDESEDPYTEYIESPTDYESIQKAVETAAKMFMEKHEYYRVGFRSISTLIAYLDPGTAFRFLSPVVGRRKRDKAVAMYTIEKGVHGEQEIQMIGSLMDGMIEFKIENLNTFLAVRGICDVQSRAFIRYTASKSAVSIGSFSLDHIR